VTGNKPENGCASAAGEMCPKLTPLGSFLPLYRSYLTLEWLQEPLPVQNVVDDDDAGFVFSPRLFPLLPSSSRSTDWQSLARPPLALSRSSSSSSSTEGEKAWRAPSRDASPPLFYDGKTMNILNI